MDFNPYYSLAGVLVGMLVGLTGVGGGSLMTPLLVLVFHFHPATAVGTDLLYASATKSVGTVVHGGRGTVDWKVVGGLATGSIPTTILTLIALSYAAKSAKDTAHAISVVLGAVLILTAIAMFFRQKIVDRFAPRIGAVNDSRITTLTVVLGAILGVLVSLTSVGAGALGMTALLVLYPRLPVNRLVGSDIAHAVPLTLIAGLGHWWIGDVNFSLLLSLLVGSVPGIIVGSIIASRVSDKVLIPISAAVLTLVGVKLVLLELEVRGLSVRQCRRAGQRDTRHAAMIPGFAFSTPIKIRYAEIDGQKVVFNSRYLEYVDVAVTEYWEWTGIAEAIGPAWQETEFHVRRVEMDYLKPFVLGDTIDANVRIERLGSSSLIKRFALAHATTGVVHCEATVSVNVHLPTGRPIPIAGPLRQFLEALIAGQPERIA